jgi:hypothetical protein
LIGCLVAILGKTVVQAVKVIYMLFMFGGSGHAYAFHLHFLRFTCIEVVDMRSFFICRDSLFIEYRNVVYFFTAMSWDKQFDYELLFSYVIISSMSNQCIITYGLNNIFRQFAC